MPSVEASKKSLYCSSARVRRSSEWRASDRRRVCSRSPSKTRPARSTRPSIDEATRRKSMARGPQMRARHVVAQEDRADDAPLDHERHGQQRAPALLRRQLGPGAEQRRRPRVFHQHRLARVHAGAHLGIALGDERHLHRRRIVGRRRPASRPLGSSPCSSSAARVQPTASQMRARRSCSASGESSVTPTAPEMCASAVAVALVALERDARRRHLEAGADARQQRAGDRRRDHDVVGARGQRGAHGLQQLLGVDLARDAGDDGGGAGRLARRGHGVDERAEAVAPRAFGATGDQHQVGALGILDDAAARLGVVAGAAQLGEVACAGNLVATDDQDAITTRHLQHHNTFSDALSDGKRRPARPGRRA